MAEKLVPVFPDETERLHQAVLQQFSWIEEDLRQQINQERLLKYDLIKIDLHSLAIKAVLKYVQLSKADEATSVLINARNEAETTLNICEKTKVINEATITAYRKMLK